MLRIPFEVFLQCFTLHGTALYTVLSVSFHIDAENVLLFCFARCVLLLVERSQLLASLIQLYLLHREFSRRRRLEN